jgi:phosphatidylinositol alpha-mannosyltransferase
VIFTGYVDGPGKHDLFRRAALVAFPSQKGEGFGLVLIEAMAARKAIVASDFAGTRAIVKDGVNGLLVDPPDADAWAAAIRKLLQDNELRENIERKNFQRAEQYDWPVIAEKFAEIYRRVLTGAADNQQHEGG